MSDIRYLQSKPGDTFQVTVELLDGNILNVKVADFGYYDEGKWVDCRIDKPELTGKAFFKERR